MDDLVITAKSAPEGRWMLEDLTELAQCAGMDFKPEKSRSLVLMKGKRKDNFHFTIAGKQILTITEKPIWPRKMVLVRSPRQRVLTR